jgi:hypothetical protein
VTAQVISLLAVRRALPPRTKTPVAEATRTLVFVPIGVWRARRTTQRGALSHPTRRPAELERLARARLLIGALPRGPYFVRSTAFGAYQRCALCGAPVAGTEHASRVEGLKAGFNGLRTMDLHPACLRALQLVSTELA